MIKADPAGTRVACLDDGTHCDGGGVTHPVLPKGGGWSDDNDVCNSPSGERQCGGSSTNYVDPPQRNAKPKAKKMHSVGLHKVLHRASSPAKRAGDVAAGIGAGCTLAALVAPPDFEVTVPCAGAAAMVERGAAGTALVADTADLVNGGASWSDVGSDVLGVGGTYQSDVVKHVATKMFGPGRFIRKDVYNRLIGPSRSIAAGAGRAAVTAERRAQSVANAVARGADNLWSERVFNRSTSSRPSTRSCISADGSALAITKHRT